MLCDPERRIVYIPVSRELLPELNEWSEPVQIRIERDGRGDMELVLRKVDSSAAEAA